MITIIHNDSKLTVEYDEEFLLGHSPALMSKTGELVGKALLRKRDQLICERDGHDQQEDICQRCFLRLGKELN